MRCVPAQVAKPKIDEEAAPPSGKHSSDCFVYEPSDEAFKALLQQVELEHARLLFEMRKNLTGEMDELKSQNAALQERVRRLSTQNAVDRTGTMGRVGSSLSTSRSRATSLSAANRRGLSEATSRITSSNLAQDIPPGAGAENHAVAGTSELSKEVRASVESRADIVTTGGSRREARVATHDTDSSRRSRKADKVPEKRFVCMLSPVSRRRLFWDTLAFIMLVVDLWMIPIELIFMSDAGIPASFKITGIITTCFFAFDIILNLSTGYIDKDKLVMDRRRCVKAYMAFWFWIDVVSTFPFDMLTKVLMPNASNNAMGMTRAARITKFTKVLKTMRFLKMIKTVSLASKSNMRSSLVDVFEPVKHMMSLIQFVVFLALLAHVHACLYAGLLGGQYLAQSNSDDALRRYYTCFRWGFNAFAAGNWADLDPEIEKWSGWLWCLEMCVAAERIGILSVFGAWGVVTAFTVFHEKAELNSLSGAAQRCFRFHHVSVETQISVMYSLHETRAAREMQKQLKVLLSEHLADELRRQVSEEMWGPHLLSFKLIKQIRTWHADFVSELALLVREEVVATRTTLCKEGHVSISAYFVISGRLSVLNSQTHGFLPDFTDGMWVGEMAFMSTTHRRPCTLQAGSLTRLMAVPSRGFHELLHQLGLEEQFHEYRARTLMHGICGRCGALGDHFTHACPVQDLSLLAVALRNTNERLAKLNQSQGADEMSNLAAFLHAHRMLPLLPLLTQLGIEDEDDLVEMNFDSLRRSAGEDAEMCRHADLLENVLLDMQAADDLAREEEERQLQHLCFLSHYKEEAGTEAALMRAEIEQVLKEELQADNENAHFVEAFAAPVFLDSEDLTTLADLQLHVRRSHNLVVLLTKAVLERPWVLIEIVTAMRDDVRIVLVKVDKGANTNFKFPSDDYYDKFLKGDILDAGGAQLLKQNNITLEETVDCLKAMFKKIALPYSPHRAESIRREEVRALFKQCVTNDLANTGSLPNQSLRVDFVNESRRSLASGSDNS